MNASRAGFIKRLSGEKILGGGEQEGGRAWETKSSKRTLSHVSKTSPKNNENSSGVNSQRKNVKKKM